MPDTFDVLPFAANYAILLEALSSGTHLTSLYNSETEEIAMVDDAMIDCSPQSMALVRSESLLHN